MTNKTRSLGLRYGLVLTVFSQTVPATAAQDDVWAPGFEEASWKKITVIQRYPLFHPEDPDLVAACKNQEPFVRAAACLAIARSGDAKYAVNVLPLLEDASPLTVECAAIALKQIAPAVLKEQLVRILGNRPSMPGLTRLQKFGLPEVGSMTLPERRAWLKSFDAAAWQIPVDHEYAFSRRKESLRGLLCCESSELDQGDPLSVRLQVVREGGQGVLQLFVVRPDDSGFWYAVTALGGRSPLDEYHRRFTLGLSAKETENRRLQRDIAPNEKVEFSFAVTPNLQMPAPGVYLLEMFHANTPLLVRIRRNRATDSTIDELIKRLPMTVPELGAQKVKAAVPALLGLFMTNANGNNFATADALARIGDPRAIPVMLTYPHMRDDDVAGDTSAALASFGAIAYPEFEKRIINWEREVAQGRASTVAMCIRLLGQHRTGMSESATLAMARKLSRQRIDYFGAEKFGELALLGAALQALAERHPEEAAEAVLAVSAHPNTLYPLLTDLLMMTPPAASAAAQKIFSRFEGRSDLLPESRQRLDQILQRHCPEFLLKAKSR